MAPRIGAGLRPVDRADLAACLVMGRAKVNIMRRVVDRRLATIRAAGMVALDEASDARRKLRRLRNPTARADWTMIAERWERLADALAAADDGF